MSCRKPTKYQIFLQKYLEDLEKTGADKKDWIKKASEIWNEHKKKDEEEVKQKMKEHEKACARKTSTKRAAGTPLRVNTVTSAVALHLSPVRLEKGANEGNPKPRTLKTCRADLQKAEETQTKRLLKGGERALERAEQKSKEIKQIGENVLKFVRKAESMERKLAGAAREDNDSDENYVNLPAPTGFRMHDSGSTCSANRHPLRFY